MQTKISDLVTMWLEIKLLLIGKYIVEICLMCSINQLNRQNLFAMKISKGNKKHYETLNQITK